MIARARDVALAVLRRVHERDAYANLVLPAEVERAGLRGRDVALATELAYGALRMQGTLDWVAAMHASRPLEDLDPIVLDALRLGTYQLLYTNIPDHAAVSETVALLRGRGGAGLVNAVLRRIASERDRIPWPGPGDDPSSAVAILHAHPRWVVDLWMGELGAAHTEPLCAANNVFPGVGVRVNDAQAGKRLREAGLDVRPCRWSRDVLVVASGGRPSTWPGFHEGAFVVQDESSVLAAAALGAGPGERVVDLCAGPGGKTSGAAACGALVVACDARFERARLVAETARRVGGRILPVQADGRRPPVALADRVLVDAPCSGLGVLRRRPEARWRVRPEDVPALAALQTELVVAASELIGPGGTLVYAVCTVTRAETTGVVDALLRRAPDLEEVEVHPEIPRADGLPGAALQLLPHVHETDGMFIAKLKRTR